MEYAGYHSDGQRKTKGYDAAWRQIQAVWNGEVGNSDRTRIIVNTLADMVQNGDIADYEADIMLNALGFGQGRGSSAKDDSRTRPTRDIAEIL